MTKPGENEHDRINKILSGQMIYFSDLIRDYQQFVNLTAIKMLKNTMDAEELTQDVFVKVYRKLHSYRKESKFTTWLYKITYNACLDRLKHKQSKFENSALSHDETLNKLSSPTRDKESVTDLFDDIISTFQPKQKMVMILFYIHHFSYIEITEIMDESISNVKTMLFRGRNELREKLSVKMRESAV